MKYMGSKARIAKYILPIILKDRKSNQYYIEPFVGGCNIIDKVNGNRIGLDNNKYLIEMWIRIKDGYRNLPMEIPKILYDEARDNFYGKICTMDDATIGWIGFMASFNGRFFDGGYSGITNKRNYIKEQINNTLRQKKNIADVVFICGDYQQLYGFPEKAIIYCDPPYHNTKQYSTSKNFDYDKFYNWCRKMKQDGHYIFISEYQMPEDFKCIWEMEVTNSLNTTKTYKPIERLFTL